MAGLRGCKDDSPLAGVCCTNMCQHWNNCTIASQPILIYTTMMKGAAITDGSGNSFQLREFPDWTNFDHNHSGVKTMTFFQPDSRTSSLFDDYEIQSPKEKELPRQICTAIIRGTVQTDPSNNFFIFDDPQKYTPIVRYS